MLEFDAVLSKPVLLPIITNKKKLMLTINQTDVNGMKYKFSPFSYILAYAPFECSSHVEFRKNGMVSSHYK